MLDVECGLLVRLLELAEITGHKAQLRDSTAALLQSCR